MTFIEAALEILRREGTPLHAKIIAEKAVSADILSHVGKTPLQTMSKRISAAVAKGKGPFLRVKPGVFALAEWQDDTGKLALPKKPPQKETVPATPAAEAAPRTADGNEGGAPVPRDGSEIPRRDDGADARGEEPTSRSRRSRNRRSKKRSRDSRQPERRPAEGEQVEVRNGTEDTRHSNTQNTAAEKNSSTEKFREKARTDRTPPFGESGRGQRTDDEGRQSAPSNVPKSTSSPGDRPRNGNRDVAVLVEQFLGQQKQPQGAKAIASRLQLSGPNAELIVEALLDADNRERRQQGRRPRFVKHKSGWALVAREISSEVVQLEDEIFLSAQRLAQITERQMQRRLKNLSTGKLAQLVILMLRHMGYSEVEPVAKGKEGECHLRISDRRQGSRFSTAVVIHNESAGRMVNEVDVTALRGTLHHYRASRGLIITPGEVSPEGFREADVPNLPPVGFIDGRLLAQEMVRCSVGVEKRMVQLTFLDESWF
ncbi:MAG: restriction endonuclease [Deltaproteobacteria bacterium]|nr:restriction endonuclease [Deltaproteobacteria bacterium]